MQQPTRKIGTGVGNEECWLEQDPQSSQDVGVAGPCNSGKETKSYVFSEARSSVHNLWEVRVLKEPPTKYYCDLYLQEDKHFQVDKHSFLSLWTASSLNDCECSVALFIKIAHGALSRTSFAPEVPSIREEPFGCYSNLQMKVSSRRQSFKNVKSAPAQEGADIPKHAEANISMSFSDATSALMEGGAAKDVPSFSKLIPADWKCHCMDPAGFRCITFFLIACHWRASWHCFPMTNVMRLRTSCGCAKIASFW